MTKNIFTFLFFSVFVCQIGYSQNNYNLDSLKQVLKTSKNDTVRINTKFLVIKASNYSPDSNILYLQKLLQETKSVKPSNKVLTDWQTNKTCNIQFALAVNYDNIGNYQTSIAYYDIVLKKSLALKNKTYTGSCYAGLGVENMHQGSYPKALEYLYKALKIKEELKDKLGILRQYGNIGIVYDEQSDFKKALDYYNKALKIALELNDDKRISLQYSNIGIVYSKQNQFETSKLFYNKALVLDQKNNNIEGIARNTSNLANDYSTLNKPLEALAYFLKLVDVFDEIGDPSFIAGNYINVGQSYSKLNQNEKAIININKGLTLAKEIKDLDLIEMGEDILANAYQESGDYKAAFTHFKAHIVAKDSLFNAANTRKSIDAEVNYEYEKKAAIAKVENEKKLAITKLENEKEVRTRNLLILITILILLIVVTGLVYFNNKKSLVLKQQYAQQLLTSQENERRRIAKELHDSVGQNILFIKNQLVKQQNDELISQVDEAIEEVRNLSKDLYPNQLEKYGLVAAVDAMTEKIKASTNIFVSHDIEVLNTNLSEEIKINYYRIIQECVSNTLKHAQASVLRITATMTEGMLELIIQDNGVGFDPSMTRDKAQKSFGLLNLEERVKLLNGTYSIETGYGSGTKSIFLIPSEV